MNKEEFDKLFELALKDVTVNVKNISNINGHYHYVAELCYKDDVIYKQTY